MSLVAIVMRYQILIDTVLDKTPTTEKINDNQHAVVVPNSIGL